MMHLYAGLKTLACMPWTAPDPAAGSLIGAGPAPWSVYAKVIMAPDTTERAKHIIGR